MINVDENRKSKKYGLITQAARILWFLSTPLFMFSPQPFYRWRVFLLRLFGAKVGQSVHIYPSAKIFFPWNLVIGNGSAVGANSEIYNLGKVIIGKSVTISQYSYLCAGTHDYTDPLMPLIKSEIHIGDYAWLCASSIVGPGVHVGEGAIIGLGCVQTKDVMAWMVHGGNPGVTLKKRELKSLIGDLNG